jgi:hypothetical protein
MERYVDYLVNALKLRMIYGLDSLLHMREQSPESPYIASSADNGVFYVILRNDGEATAD